MPNRIKSLSQVEAGTHVKIIMFSCGRTLRARLLDMGLVPGLSIEVVSQGASGPYIIASNRGRLALGRGMAHKIIVSEQ